MKEQDVVKLPFYPALVKFVEGVNAMVAAYWKEHNLTYNSAPVVMVESVGKRYARLATFEAEPAFSENRVAKSVYCFLDLTNGDLLKGSWKAPVARGVRGNLSDPNVLSHFNHFGPNYLRG
jgi:hypothetical protein